MPEAFSTFRVQGISEGTCWIDGEGNEVDTDVAVPDDPNAGAPQTLVASITNSSIEQVDDTDLLSFICQQEKPVEGEYLAITKLNCSSRFIILLTIKVFMVVILNYFLIFFTFRLRG